MFVSSNYVRQWLFYLLYLLVFLLRVGRRIHAIYEFLKYGVLRANHGFSSRRMLPGALLLLGD